MPISSLKARFPSFQSSNDYLVVYDRSILIFRIRQFYVSFFLSLFISLFLDHTFFPSVKDATSYSPLALIAVSFLVEYYLALPRVPCVPDVAAFTAYNCREDAARRPAQLFGDKRRYNRNEGPRGSRSICVFDTCVSDLNRAICVLRCMYSREWIIIWMNYIFWKYI